LPQWHTEKNSCVLPDLICKRCGRFSSAFESVMGADLLLNVRSLLDETSDRWWYLHTLIYSASRVLPLFVRAEQSDQFRTPALGPAREGTKVWKIVCFVLRGAGLFKDAYEPRSVGHNQLIKAKHSAKTSAGIVDDLAKRRLPSNAYRWRWL